MPDHGEYQRLDTTYFSATSPNPDAEAILCGLRAWKRMPVAGTTIQDDGLTGIWSAQDCITPGTKTRFCNDRLVQVGPPSPKHGHQIPPVPNFTPTLYHSRGITDIRALTNITATALHDEVVRAGVDDAIGAPDPERTQTIFSGLDLNRLEAGGPPLTDTLVATGSGATYNNRV
jgi:hypothetical protein